MTAEESGYRDPAPPGPDLLDEIHVRALDDILEGLTLDRRKHVLDYWRGMAPERRESFLEFLHAMPAKQRSRFMGRWQDMIPGRCERFPERWLNMTATDRERFLGSAPARQHPRQREALKRIADLLTGPLPAALAVTIVVVAALNWGLSPRTTQANGSSARREQTSPPTGEIRLHEVIPNTGVTFALDGKPLAPGTTRIPRPPHGKVSLLRVNADGYHQDVLRIDDNTPEVLDIVLAKASRPKAR